MPCGTRVIWDPVPNDCTLKLQATGDEDLFNVFASVRCNGVVAPPLRHHMIVPGPVRVPISADGTRWLIKPTLFLSADTDEPVILRAWLENADGSPVMIQDDDGSLFAASCEWQTDDDAAPIRVKISVGSGA